VQRVGAKLDLPTIIGGQRAVADHKTTTQWLNNHWYRQRFALGHQLRIYCAAMESLTGEEFCVGYINGIYIGPEPKSGWARVQSVQNKLFEPQHFGLTQFAETWEWVHAHARTIDLWREIGLWPQNEGACDDYGGCDFLEICRANPIVRPSLLTRGFERWEPEGVLASGADGNASVEEAA
jgi:hypothetical protein